MQSLDYTERDLNLACEGTHCRSVKEQLQTLYTCIGDNKIRKVAFCERGCVAQDSDYCKGRKPTTEKSELIESGSQFKIEI